MTITWTPERDERLRSLYESGMTMPHVADLIGVSLSAAWKRAHKIGVKARERGQPKVIWTADMDAKLIELRAKGLGYVACGEVIGVADETVKRRVNEIGLPTWSKQGGRRSHSAARVAA